MQQPKPDPTSVVTSPSGVEIAYWSLKTPWNRKTRWYEIRKTDKSQWKEVPSVTTILNVLAKDALTWWGMRVGIQGVLSLYNIGLLGPSKTLEGANVLACAGAAPVGEHGLHSSLVVAGVPQVEELLKKCKLTTNDVRDAAGDRGQSVHDAFEAWARDGFLPEPDLYPLTERGYVRGLRRFIEESGATPLAVEVQVGSVKYGYAGRFDVVLEYPEDVEIVVHHTPVKGEQKAVIPKGRWLADLKTSRSAYPSHALQLAAYEVAAIECGYGATDGRGIIHVDAEGQYKFIRCNAEGKDFIQILRTHRTMSGSKGWLG